LKPAALILDHVSLVRSGKVILSDIQLTVQTGQTCAIMGPNGAGKSALIALLAGYNWPTRGTVLIEGRAFGAVSMGTLRSGIGLIEPSRTPAFAGYMTVREVVATGLFGTIVLPMHQTPGPDQWIQVDQEIASLGLAGLAYMPFAQLSSGEQMKTLLARALIADARILLLDEPTAGLDMGARAACMKTLERVRNRPNHPTLVIVTHHVDELPSGVDQVVLIRNGVILEQGLPGRVLTDKNLSLLFDCRVHVQQQDGRYWALAL